MRIFGRREKEEISELSLLPAQESGRFHFFAALSKALLIFMLVYGALGGFLSAFDIDSNSGLCMTVLFGVAFLLSAVYESGKRWLMNVTSLAVFAVYLYIAVANYWVINSGYYAILNRFYEVARNYLDVDSGMEYSLAVEESYGTVTMFALFLGMVGVILFNIMLQNKCSLLKVALLTLTPFGIPFYFECSPDPIYVLLLLGGYAAVAVLQGGNVRERLSGQMRYAVPFAVVLAVCTVRAAMLLFPETAYGRITPKNAAKAASEEEMVQFAQYGLTAMLRRGSAGAGVSGGMLSKSPSLMPTYETVLKVRYTPYDYEPVYLKAFTGKAYLGDRWSEAAGGLPDDGDMRAGVQSRRDSYEKAKADGATPVQGRGVMEVEKEDAADQYDYLPYYTSGEESAEEAAKEHRAVYVYYPDVGAGDKVQEEVSEDYLEVPESCADAVEKVCEEAGFAGTQEEIAAQIVHFFQDNYAYTLRPGYYFGDPDYISHFLLESKKGYCAHFASAATMLFRQMGIPARYAEGYAFSYANVVESGELVEDASYSDYYDGYSPIGETALVELEIPDAYAHAWVELYVDGRGWIVVDPTPAQSEQGEAVSFWDVFMAGGGNSGDMEMARSDLGDYLTGALGGAGYVLFGAAVLFLFAVAAARLLRMYRESRLPGRERVKLEYGRLQAYLRRKDREYGNLRTLQEQLAWAREHGGDGIEDGLAEALYQVYFAEHATCDCEAICRALRRIRRKMYLRP